MKTFSTTIRLDILTLATLARELSSRNLCPPNKSALVSASLSLLADVLTKDKITNYQEALSTLDALGLLSRSNYTRELITNLSKELSSTEVKETLEVDPEEFKRALEGLKK